MHKREVCNPIRCIFKSSDACCSPELEAATLSFFIGERIGGDTLYIQAKIDSDLGFSEKTETFI